MKCTKHDACIYSQQEGCLKDKACIICGDQGKVMVHGVIDVPLEVKCQCQPPRKLNMSEIQEIAKSLEEVAPEGVAVQAVEATAKTVADPTVINIVEDLNLAHTLYAEFKEKIGKLHPSISSIFNALF